MCCTVSPVARGVGLAVVACLAALALLLPGRADAARQFETAVVDHWDGVDTTWDFQQTSAAGATKVRLSVHWSAVEPTSSRYEWAPVDAQVTSAVAAGLEPILSIHSTPRWARDKRIAGRWVSDSTTPKLDAFEAFAKAAARRYSGIVQYWQAWNEPNLAMFLRPQRVGRKYVSPVNYRMMTRRFSNAVNSVDPSNVVVAGGTAPYNGAPLRFMRKMLCLRKNLTAIGACPASRADVWAHHPYTSGGPNHHAYNRNDVSLGDLPEMRRVLDAAIKRRKIVPTGGGGGVRFWITEFSWDTDRPDWGMRGREQTGPGEYLGRRVSLSPSRHARWVAEAMYRMWQSRVSLVAWFKVADGPMKTSPYQSGLHYVGKTRKPAFNAFRFPFVALAKDGRLTVWGRVPPPSAYGESVVVQRRVGSRWVRVKVLKTSSAGIFSARWRPNRTGGYFRAVLPARGDASRKFSSAPTKDVLLRRGPFGCGGDRCQN